jgi:hypothetical protein
VKNFNTSVKDLGRHKLLEVGMDGPSVNLKALRIIKSESASRRPLDIRSCSLHVVDGALRTGDKKAKIGLMSFLHCSYQLFKDLPSRRGDLVFADCPEHEVQFPLPYCAIRWVENVSVAARFLCCLGCLATSSQIRCCASMLLVFLSYNENQPRSRT